MLKGKNFMSNEAFNWALKTKLPDNLKSVLIVLSVAASEHGLIANFDTSVTANFCEMDLARFEDAVGELERLRVIARCKDYIYLRIKFTVDISPMEAHRNVH
jgi:hypothetical protein